MAYAIPDIPEWVENEIAKMEFQRREALKVQNEQLHQSFSLRTRGAQLCNQLMGKDLRATYQ